MSPRTRNALIGGVALIAAIIAFLLLRGEGKWSVTVTADPAETVPWIPVRLAADLKGAPKDKKGWQFKWTADDGTVESTGANAVWRGASIGEHRMELRVTSPAGTQQVATVDFQVQLPRVVSDWTNTPSDAPAPKPPPPGSSPIEITSVEVEKSEVCAGEPSVIKVKANNGGTDRDLMYLIDGHAGDQGSYVRFGGAPGMHRIKIQVIDKRHGDIYQSTDAYIMLKDCKQELPMLLEARTAPPTPDEYTLKVGFPNIADADKIPEGKPEEIAPNTRPTVVTVDPRIREFHWTFGDGQTAVSQAPTINHVFPHEYDRSEKLQQTYLVAVESVDVSGNVLSRANAPVTLTSMINDMKYRWKKLELSADYVAFPKHEDDGTYTQEVTLLNSDATETANLSDLTLDFRNCRNGESSEKRSLAASNVFPGTSIPPRGRLSGKMILTEGDLKDRCALHVTVNGSSDPSNLQVEGFFMVRTGVGAGSQTISDPGKVAAVNQAMKILNKTFVTPEDIQRLEEEGKITPGLLTQSAATAPPQNLPPPRPRAAPPQ